jgi:hypothetical protein
MHSHLFPALPVATPEHLLSSQIQVYKFRENNIPEIITAIWVGPELPETTDQPYFSNLLKHKQFNPDAKVQLLVCKKLLVANSQWDALVSKCEAANIVLRDIEETCSTYINFDIIKKFLEGDEKDYVWLSDLLRLSVMYHEGGYYFDTDLEPIAALEKIPCVYGFFQAFAETRSRPDIFYCFQASVPFHPFYLHQASVSRHFYECFDELATKKKPPSFVNTTFAQVRLQIVSTLSGSPYPTLHDCSSIQNLFSELFMQANYPLHKTCNMRFDNTWLKKFPMAEDKDFGQFSEQLREFGVMHRSWMKFIDNGVLLRRNLMQHFPDIYREAIAVQDPYDYHSGLRR